MCTGSFLSFVTFKRYQSAYQDFRRYSFYTQVEMKPPLLANAVLGMKREAHYPVTYTHIKTFTAGSGTQQVSTDNAFLCPIPEIILIAMIKNAELDGSASTNPFHFHH